MDILITLPLHLCKELLSGRKTVELRSTYPKHFNPLLNKVYVVTKGTHTICLVFTVRRFVEFTDVETCWDYVGNKICASREWFTKYAETKRKLVAWEIGLVSPYMPHLSTHKRLNIKSNPQSFIYVS